jgi:predicted acylesterase/phospholipase RssA
LTDLRNRFVCAQAKETGGVTLLRSYRPKGDEPGEATIWQAALATSAATSFFYPVRIGDRLYVDGAMGANNPANQIQKEADKIWCETSGRLEPLVKCFISLGTGNGGINPISDKAWKFLTESLTAVATDTRLTEQDVATRWKDYQDTRYFRFNVQQGLQKLGLAEYKEKGLLEAATTEYLDSQDTKPRVYKCVMNLRTKECQHHDA